jgi:hypothetical protein
MLDKRFYIPGTVDDRPSTVDIESPLIKEASASLAPSIQAKISSLPKEEGFSYALLTAVEAGETWGSNKRGDYFLEQGPPPEYDNFGKILWGLKLENEHFGYKTFLQAKFFKEHQSKDPKRSAGVVVDVFYDDDMHRVDLILKIDRRKAVELGMQEYLVALDNNLPIDYSMGCRTPFDVCSVHGDIDKVFSILSNYQDPYAGVKAILAENKRNHIPGFARVVDYDPSNPMQIKAGVKPEDAYCDLRKYHMNELMPDGTKICNITTHPVFYDISWVKVGAGPIAKNITKLASAYNTNPEKHIYRNRPTSVFIEKQASAVDSYLKKNELLTSDTTQQITAPAVHTPYKVRAHNLPILRRILQRLHSGPLLPYQMLTSNPIEELISVLTRLGIILHPREFNTCMLSGSPLAPAVYSGVIGIEPSRIVQKPEFSMNLDFSTSIFNKLKQMGLMSMLATRSISEDYLHRPAGEPVKSIAVHIIRIPKLPMWYNGYRNAALNQSVPAGLVPDLTEFLRYKSLLGG